MLRKKVLGRVSHLFFKGHFGIYLHLQETFSLYTNACSGSLHRLTVTGVRCIKTKVKLFSSSTKMTLVSFKISTTRLVIASNYTVIFLTGLAFRAPRTLVVGAYHRSSNKNKVKLQLVDRWCFARVNDKMI